jgi:uncharacterized protein YceH (UPF0502 family)
VRFDAARATDAGGNQDAYGTDYDFSDLEEAEMVIHKLGPMVQKLPPASGMKEPRYAQTLGGAVEHLEVHHAPAASSDRLAALEGEVARLREEVAELRRRLEAVL